MPDFNISAIRNKTKSRHYARAELMFYYEFFYYTTSSYRIRCGFFNKLFNPSGRHLWLSRKKRTVALQT